MAPVERTPPAAFPRASEDQAVTPAQRLLALKQEGKRPWIMPGAEGKKYGVNFPYEAIPKQSPLPAAPAPSLVATEVQPAAEKKCQEPNPIQKILCYRAVERHWQPGEIHWVEKFRKDPVLARLYVEKWEAITAEKERELELKARDSVLESDYESPSSSTDDSDSSDSDGEADDTTPLPPSPPPIRGSQPSESLMDIVKQRGLLDEPTSKKRKLSEDHAEATPSKKRVVLKLGGRSLELDLQEALDEDSESDDEAPPPLPPQRMTSLPLWKDMPGVTEEESADWSEEE